MRTRRSRQRASHTLLALLLACGCLLAFAGECGDGICQEPENDLRCPEDCGPCLVPNPVRADVYEDLVGWHNWMEDGGFELGTTALYGESPIPGLRPADVEWVEDDDEQHDGTYVVRVETGNAPGTLSIHSEIEKGEQTRYTIWARSTGAPVPVKYNAYGIEESLDPAAPPIL